jgi:hypothetical protein
VTNASYDAAVPAGGSTTFGLLGTRQCPRLAHQPELLADLTRHLISDVSAPNGPGQDSERGLVAGLTRPVPRQRLQAPGAYA